MCSIVNGDLWKYSYLNKNNIFENYVGFLLFIFLSSHLWLISSIFPIFYKSVKILLKPATMHALVSVFLFSNTLQVQDNIIRTYKHWYYNASVRITTYHLTPLTLCVLILYMRSKTYSLKSTPKGGFLKNFKTSLKKYWNFLLLEMADLGFEPWPHV